MSSSLEQIQMCSVYVYHNIFINSSISGHLGCFHVLSIVNSTSVNIGVHISFSVSISSGYMPSSRIYGPYGGFIPSFSRSLHTIFHSGCIRLHSHQQYKSISLFLFCFAFINLMYQWDHTTSVSI